MFTTLIDGCAKVLIHSNIIFSYMAKHQTMCERLQEIVKALLIGNLSLLSVYAVEGSFGDYGAVLLFLRCGCVKRTGRSLALFLSF